MAQLQTTGITGSLNVSTTITAVSFTSSRASGVGFLGTASFALTPSGTSGTSGANGSSGTSGANGSSGTSGANGSSGTSGATVAGSSGTSGANGSSGTSGATVAGSSGTSGTSASVTINNNTDNYLVTATGTTNTLNGESTVTLDGTTFTANTTNFVVNSTNITVGNDTTDIVSIAGNTVRVTGNNVGIGTTAPVYTLHLAAADTQNTYPTTASINITNTNSAAFSRTMGVNFSVGAGAPTEVFAGIYGVYTNYTTTVGGAIAFVTNNGSNSFTEKMRIISNGNVGIGTTTIPSRLSISGSSNGSTPVVDIVVGGTDAFSRGVRMINSSMTNGSSLMYAVGRSDNARNMGQFYFVYTADGSTSNRLSMGLHSVDDVFNILGSGMVGIGATAAYVDANDKLVVAGGRLAVNAGAYTAASFNRSTNGNITEFLVGGIGRGAVTFDGTNLNLVSFTGMNLYANYTTSGIFISSSGFVSIGTTDNYSRLTMISNSETTGISLFTPPYISAREWGTRIWKNDIGGGIPLQVDTGYIGTWYPSIRINHGLNSDHPSLQTFRETNLATTAGNVGIGTTSATDKLTIQGTSLKFYTTQNVANQYTYIGTEYANANGNNKAEIRFAIDGADTRTRIQFHTANGAANIGERMRIDYNGNVGIGTTSPSARLHVAGGDGTVVMVQRLSKGQYADSGGHTTFLGLGVETATWSKSAIGHQRTAGYDVGDMIFCLNNSVDASDVGTTHERMRIKSDGNVGIGVTPSYKLDVNGDIRVRGEGNSLYFDTNNDSASIRMRTISSFVFSISNSRGTSSEMRLGNTNIQFFTNTSERFTIFSSGNVGIGTTTDPAYKLRVQGQIYASDDIIAYSDARAKENVVTLDNALNKVTNLRGVYYTRKDDETKKKNVGVIAQEVLEVVPELVSYSEQSDEYAVKYQNITALLIEAIKEQQQTILSLQNRIETLENQ